MDISPAVLTASATIMQPLIKEICETYLKPKAVSFCKKMKINKALFLQLENIFEQYLERGYKKNSYMKTIVFQNQQKELKDLYVPLNVEMIASRDTIRIDTYKDDFLPKVKKTILIDTAGMGKSTILKFLYLSAIDNKSGIPVLVELRKLTKTTKLIDIIYEELCELDKAFEKEVMFDLIKRGDFIFLFDGYDEITLSEREEVTSDLQDFISKAEKNIFAMTSRPEPALACFADFMQYKIVPLTKEEAFELINKYGQYSEVSAALIKKLKTKDYIEIEKFLENPLLVSLLFKTFTYKSLIPTKKHSFFRQVYDALFESHDITKGGYFIRKKHSNLDMDDFFRVLRGLGFVTAKDFKLEYSKDELISYIALIKTTDYFPDLKSKFAESCFLKDLTTTVPIFIVDGNFYRWSHKSLQDYFAASFICTDLKEKQEDVLKSIYISGLGFECGFMLELCHEIDPKMFRRSILLLVLQDILKKNAELFAYKMKGISKDDITERKRHMLFRKNIFEKPEFHDFGEMDDVTKDFCKKGLMGDGETLSCISITSSTYGLNKSYGIYYKYSPIVEMLADCYCDCFEKVKNERIAHKDIKKLLDQFEINKHYLVDDKPDNILNSKDNFNFTTDIVKYGLMTAGKHVVVNFDKCAVLLDEIYAELENGSSTDAYSFNKQ